MRNSSELSGLLATLLWGGNKRRKMWLYHCKTHLLVPLVHTLNTGILTYLLTYLLTYPLTYLLTYLPTYLPTYLLLT